MNFALSVERTISGIEQRCIARTIPQTPLRYSVARRVKRRIDRMCPFRKVARMAKSTKPSALLDTRVIYCGDNLDQLRKLPDACVDLIYIDPARPPANLRESLPPPRP